MTAYLKAILAAATATVASLVTALSDNVITPAEWLIALGALIVGLGGTALIPNTGFVNLNRVDSYQLAEAGAAARSTFEGRLPGADNTAREDWTQAARAVVSSLRR